MTAPYFTPPPGPDLRPQSAPPVPGFGETLGQAGGDLAKVLMALRQLSQTSQIENRQLDVQQEGYGIQRDQESRLRAGALYDQQQNQLKLDNQSQVGSALRPLLGDYPSTAGVSDANLPGTVESLNKVKDLRKKDQEALGPTSVQEFQHYQGLLAAGKTDEAAEYRKLFLEKQPGVQVNVNSGENQHAKAIADVNAGFYKTAIETANAAYQLMPSIANASNLVDRSFTGAGANARLNVARMLSVFGVKSEGDQAADTQTLKRLAQENTLAFLGTRALGSGTAVSDKDREYMQSLSGENIALEPVALKRIFRINFGTQIMKVQEAVKEIRQQAFDYPNDANQLNARADQLERQLHPMFKQYSKMIQDEGRVQMQKEAKDAQDAERLLRQRGQRTQP